MRIGLVAAGGAGVGAKAARAARLAALLLLSVASGCRGDAAPDAVRIAARLVDPTHRVGAHVEPANLATANRELPAHEAKAAAARLPIATIGDETRYVLFEGALGDFDSHELVAELPGGSDTEGVAHDFGVGSRYLLVGLARDAAAGGCAGSLGDGRGVDPTLGSP